jgi:hypothetical protein
VRRLIAATVDVEDAALDFTADGLKQAGFDGFTTFAALLGGELERVPREAGAYVVIRSSPTPPSFLETSCGGHFKGRNPTATAETPGSKWINECSVLYIGKADRSSPKRSLYHRLREYALFGSGKPIGHWGGRYIWQLADSADLVVAWRVAAPGQTGADVEAELVSLFKQRFGRLPFANIADPSRRKR